MCLGIPTFYIPFQNFDALVLQSRSTTMWWWCFTSSSMDLLILTCFKRQYIVNEPSLPTLSHLRAPPLVLNMCPSFFLTNNPPFESPYIECTIYFPLDLLLSKRIFSQMYYLLSTRLASFQKEYLVKCMDILHTSLYNTPSGIQINSFLRIHKVNK